MPALPGYESVEAKTGGGSFTFPDGNYNATVKSATRDTIKSKAGDEYQVVKIIFGAEGVEGLHEDTIFVPTVAEFMSWDDDRKGRFKGTLEGLGLQPTDLDTDAGVATLVGKIVEMTVRTYKIKQGKNAGKQRTGTSYKRVVSDSPQNSMPTAAELLRQQAAQPPALAAVADDERPY